MSRKKHDVSKNKLSSDVGQIQPQTRIKIDCSVHFNSLSINFIMFADGGDWMRASVRADWRKLGKAYVQKWTAEG